MASLPMYDFPELAAAHGELWAAIAAALAPLDIAAPERLANGFFGDPRAAWLAPGLFLSQACGWPLVTELAGRVTVVGAFHYDVPEARGATYRSVIVARPELAAADHDLGSLHQHVAAVNGLDSLSGWISLRRAVPGAESGWPGPTVVTGSHLASLEALALGEAQVASIDAVTFALLHRLHPELTAAVQVVGHGPRVPTLPLVTAPTTEPSVLAALRHVLAGVVEDPSLRAVRADLLISGFSPLDVADYDSVAALAT